MLIQIALIIHPLLVSAQCLITGSQTFGFYVASDTNNWVFGPDKPGGGNAVQVTPHSAWTASIPGAVWIWDNNVVSNPGTDQTSFFINEFFIHGTPLSGTYQVAGDDRVWTSINGQSVNYDISTLGFFTSAGQKSLNVTSYLRTGINVIQITVTNSALAGSSSSTNPAGLLYKLAITSKFPE